MISFLRLKLLSQVGLDMNAEEIRLLQFKPGRESFMVENFAIASLPLGAIVDGKIKQFDVVLAVTQRLVKQTTTQGLKANLAISASCVKSKRVRLPAGLSHAAREAAIHQHLAQYFPESEGALCFDFARLHLLPPDQEEVLVVAVAVEQLNAYVMIASLSGLKVAVVDVDFYAEKRALAWQEMKRPHLKPELNVATFREQGSRLLVCSGLAMRSVSQ
ncbi:MAG: pilus assembly protein PilM [Gammaproteobacteria bacterium]|nr:pilus assembly protein PilM [Gammaproteobacteria bacterium]